MAFGSKDKKQSKSKGKKESKEKDKKKKELKNKDKKKSKHKEEPKDKDNTRKDSKSKDKEEQKDKDKKKRDSKGKDKKKKDSKDKDKKKKDSKDKDKKKKDSKDKDKKKKDSKDQDKDKKDSKDKKRDSKDKDKKKKDSKEKKKDSKDKDKKQTDSKNKKKDLKDKDKKKKKSKDKNKNKKKSKEKDKKKKGSKGKDGQKDKDKWKFCQCCARKKSETELKKERCEKKKKKDEDEGEYECIYILYKQVCCQCWCYYRDDGNNIVEIDPETCEPIYRRPLHVCDPVEPSPVCQPPGILIWLIILLSAIIAITFSLLCYDFTQVALDRHDLDTWTLTVLFLWFVVLSGLIFLTCFKNQVASGCCCCCGVTIWLLFHLTFAIAAFNAIYNTSTPTHAEVVAAYQAEMSGPNPPPDGPAWLVYIQEDNFCCLRGTNGQHLGTQATAARCNQYFNTTQNTFNPHILTCDKELANMYDKCLDPGMVFVILLLILGTIPFVVAYKAYQKLRERQRIRDRYHCDEVEDSCSEDAQEERPRRVCGCEPPPPRFLERCKPCLPEVQKVKDECTEESDGDTTTKTSGAEDEDCSNSSTNNNDQHKSKKKDCGDKTENKEDGVKDGEGRDEVEGKRKVVSKPIKKIVSFSDTRVSTDPSDPDDRRTRTLSQDSTRKRSVNDSTEETPIKSILANDTAPKETPTGVTPTKNSPTQDTPTEDQDRKVPGRSSIPAPVPTTSDDNEPTRKMSKKSSK